MFVAIGRLSVRQSQTAVVSEAVFEWTINLGFLPFVPGRTSGKAYNQPMSVCLLRALRYKLAIIQRTIED